VEPAGSPRSHNDATAQRMTEAVDSAWPSSLSWCAPMVARFSSATVRSVVSESN